MRIPIFIMSDTVSDPAAIRAQIAKDQKKYQQPLQVVSVDLE